jgi:hypothetical protein
VRRFLFFHYFSAMRADVTALSGAHVCDRPARRPRTTPGSCTTT